MNKSHQEHFPHFDAANLEIVLTQVLFQSFHLLLGSLSLALLGAPNDNIIFLVVWDHRLEVDVLVLASHVPRLNINIQVGHAVLASDLFGQ